MKALKTFLIGFLFLGYYLVILNIFSDLEIAFAILTITLVFLSPYLTLKHILSINIIFGICLVGLIFLQDAIISITIIFMFFVFLSSYFGHKLGKRKWIKKLVLSLLIILVSVIGFRNVFSLEKNVHSRLNTTPPSMVFHQSDGSSIKLDTVKNKIIVLDVWTTNCAVCFEKFPEFERVFEDYTSNPKVELYALNIPLKTDTLGQAKKVIEKYHYKFPELYATSDSITKELDFNTYPHLIIIKNGRLRYNGALVLDNRTYFYNLKNEIELLLNE